VGLVWLLNRLSLQWLQGVVSPLSPATDTH
jgi:hypothetical protein